MTQTETTAQFDVWIAEHYEELKEQIGAQGFLDEDAFHDTYLAIWDALTSEMGVSRYERLFKATYRELRRKQLSASYRTVNPSDLFFRMLADETQAEDETAQKRQRVTAQQVKDYAATALKKSDYKIFHLRFCMDMPLQYIGDYIGRSTAAVCIHVHSIQQQLRQHFRNCIHLTK